MMMMMMIYINETIQNTERNLQQTAVFPAYFTNIAVHNLILMKFYSACMVELFEMKLSCVFCAVYL